MSVVVCVLNRSLACQVYSVLTLPVPDLETAGHVSGGVCLESQSGGVRFILS